MKQFPNPGDRVRITAEEHDLYDQIFYVANSSSDRGTVIVAVPSEMIRREHRHKFFLNKNGYVPFTFAEEEVEIVGDKTISLGKL